MSVSRLSFRRKAILNYKERIHKKGRRIGQRLRQLEELQVLDSDTNRHLLRPVRHLRVILAVEEELIRSVRKGVGVSFVVLAGIGVLCAPLLSGLWINADYALTSWGIIYLCYLIMIIVALLLPYGVIKILPPQCNPLRRSPRSSMVWVFAVVAVYGSSAYGYIQTLSSDRVSALHHLIISTLLGVALLHAAALLAWIVVPFVSDTLKGRVIKKCPDAVLVIGLFRILSMVALDPAKWGDLDFKREITGALEEVATGVEKGFPSKLRAGDGVTNAWLEDIFLKIAWGFRDLKQWVYMPASQTRSDFITRISKDLVTAVEGDWDKLPRGKPIKLSRPQLIHRVVSVIKVAFYAVLPFLILWVLQLSQYELTEAIRNHVTIGAVSWAVLIIIISIDPAFIGKIRIPFSFWRK